MEFYDVLVGQGYALGDTLSPPAEVVRLARIRSGYADAEASVAGAPAQPGAVHAARPLLRKGRRRGPAGL